MDLELLDRTLAAAGEPAFRARQAWRWTAGGAGGYEDMTDLPAALRARLEAEVPYSTLTLAHEATARDGTVKALFHTHDGRPVEAVLMRYRDGRPPPRPPAALSPPPPGRPPRSRARSARPAP